MINEKLKLFLFKLKFFKERIVSSILKKKIKKITRYNEFEKVIKSKKFSTNWFLNNYKIFSFFFPTDINKKFNYLEIGSFEGMSALFVLYFWKNSNVTCIDTWEVSSDKSQILDYCFDHVESSFDKNLENYKFNKIKDNSKNALKKLKENKMLYDYIYIDGSHNGSVILNDAVASFELLNKNGVLIFDDIQTIYNEISTQPYDAFKNFYKLYSSKIKILYLKNLAIIKKN